MSIPSFTKFFRPVLEAYRNNERNGRRLRDVADEIGEYFKLSEEEKRELVPSRRQTKLFNRVSWAKSYLTNAGLLRSTTWGHSEITDRGSKALDSQDKIDIEYLRQFDSFREFRSRATETSKDTNETPEDIDEQAMTPEESIEQNFSEIKESLARDLLSRIHSEKPQFLERLIVDLLKAMGYGDTGKITGGPKDNGVDGMIHQDRLGIDRIYLQAKRYAPENKITGKQIREFGGALKQKQVDKGVFITTSSFTKDALEAAKDLNITTIDGNRLVELMIEHDVGCQVDRTYQLKKIDLDYFESD